MHRWPTPRRSRPCRTHRSPQHVSVPPGDAGLLASLGQAFALGQLHLDLAQRHHNLLGADLSTSRHPGLLWCELILSISPAQKQPATSEPLPIWPTAHGTPTICVGVSYLADKSVYGAERVAPSAPLSH